MEYFWAKSTKELIIDLKKELGEERLKKLSEKKPLIHFFYSFRQWIFFILSTYFLIKTENIFLIIFFSAFSGLAIFNFLTLLHEALHNLIFKKKRDFLNNLMANLYSLPTTISPTQFTKWHLDHHAQLGSELEDPKRDKLAPKKNSRLLKILYFTPFLFFIYFDAQRKENKKYPDNVQNKIKKERLFFIFIHLIFISLLLYFGGLFVFFKAYFLPLFVFFPIFFGINRMGQHYARSSKEPLGWTTFIPGSPLWDFLFLKSNYHLEHHLFPMVPFYNLKKLQKLLFNFYEKNNLISYNFLELFYLFIFKNRQVYTIWK